MSESTRAPRPPEDPSTPGASEEGPSAPKRASDRLRKSRAETTDWLEARGTRSFPDGWTGDVHIWDIDETYLATDLEGRGKLGILSIAFEKAHQKQHVPGAPALLRALHDSGPPGEESPAIYFVSASPRQMREVLEEKLRQDGVPFDGVTLKRAWRSIRRGRIFGAAAHYRRQVPYKLAALFLHARDLPEGARVVLVGDDSEQDALIYTLFADVDAGRLAGAALDRALAQAEVNAEERQVLHGLLDGYVPGADRVDRILIRLTGNRPPEALAPFERSTVGLVCGVADLLQAALRLFADDRLNLEALVRVARSWLEDAGGSDLDLLTSILDAERRRLVGAPRVAEVFERFLEAKLLPGSVRYAPPEDEGAVAGADGAGDSGTDTSPGRPLTPPELL